MPLIQQKKEINEINNNIINKNNEKNYKEKIVINNENKTKENTDEYIDIKNDNDINNKNNLNQIVLIKEKEKTIKNYKKYNFFTDPNSNYNNFTKKYKIKINEKKRFRDIHPFLKTFNPKFLKKENIDKKIFRRFRKFFKCFYKNNKNAPILSKNVLFWKKFNTKNLLPPVKIENDNGQIIDHKSFSTKYLLWLFNQEGTVELYKLFVDKEKENLINNFIIEYDLYECDEPNIIEKLKQYIDLIPEIYYTEKKEILEDNNILNKDNTIYKKEDNENNNNNLESLDSEMSFNNPFNLNFDLIEKKSFKELSYESNDLYFNEGSNFNNHDELFNRNERFYLDLSFSNKLL